MNRGTHALINLNNIESNIKKIIDKYNNFKYYFGVVKNDCYGHGNKSIKSLIKGGINYLVVATLEEAIEIRSIYKDIPILCLGIVKNKCLNLANDYNITITITSLDYLNTLNINELKKIKVHLKINTGMNRLGISSLKEFKSVLNILNNNHIFIEGIYSHIYNAKNIKDTNKQYQLFENYLSLININNILIIHLQASDALCLYDKKPYINGVRLGIIMYGFTSDKTLKLLSTFKLYSDVVQINHLKKGDSIGYEGLYTAKEDEIIAVIEIGYADGIIRKNTGRYVYINNKKYQIVGNICMDMLFVKVDDTVKLLNKTEVLKDNTHIDEVADYLGTINYEIISLIGKRVPRYYTL